MKFTRTRGKFVVLLFKNKSISGREIMVEFLISRGANVSLGDKDQLTPLHSAAQKGITQSISLNCLEIDIIK